MDETPVGRIGPHGRDDTLTRALRELYAAPRDAAYWDALEARILARLAEEGDAWWTAFRGWVRVGVAAAVLALVAAGAMLSRAREAEARLAYERVDQPETLAQQIATGTSDLPAREATLRYVISP
jgi:hypothetical protein